MVGLVSNCLFQYLTSLPSSEGYITSLSCSEGYFSIYWYPLIWRVLFTSLPSSEGYLTSLSTFRLGGGWGYFINIPPLILRELFYLSHLITGVLNLSPWTDTNTSQTAISRYQLWHSNFSTLIRHQCITGNEVFFPYQTPTHHRQ